MLGGSKLKMNIKKSKKSTFCLAILGLLCFVTVSYAAIVYQDGNNKVTNTERWQYIYDGYGQCQGSQRVGQYRYYQVYIRYSGGASGDTGRIYSGESLDDRIASVSYTYYDTLNPFAPKTKFNYGFEKSLWNIVPYNKKEITVK